MSWTKSFSAVWQNEVIAKADKKKCVELEGNIFFPEDSIKTELLSDSTKTTTCNWKGVASYYNVTVKGKTNTDCALSYKDPKPEASKIKGFVAFFKGISIENTS